MRCSKNFKTSPISLLIQVASPTSFLPQFTIIAWETCFDGTCNPTHPLPKALLFVLVLWCFVDTLISWVVGERGLFGGVQYFFWQFKSCFCTYFLKHFFYPMGMGGYSLLFLFNKKRTMGWEVIVLCLLKHFELTILVAPLNIIRFIDIKKA